MSNTPNPEQTNDYPFFTSAPAKPKTTGWKLLTLALAVCLAGTVYLLATGWRPVSGSSEETLITIDDYTMVQDKALKLERENKDLTAENQRLKEENNGLSNRVIELLNECNDLSMKLEQGSLSDEELQEISDTVDSYNMLINCYVALLRRDTTTLNNNVQILMEQVNDLPPDARNALYILLEYMDKF